MKRLMPYWLIISFLFSPLDASAVPVTSQEAASQILSTLEKQLPSLSAQKQGHLAIRLWRVRGDEAYLRYVQTYAAALRADLKRYAEISDVASSVRQISIQLVKPGSKPSRKMKKRAQAMRSDPDFAFNRRLLFLAYQMKTLGLETGEAAPDYAKALRYLERADWNAFLLNPEMIRYNATRATNALHYLEAIGLKAPRAEYETAFRKVFMEIADEKLASVEFLNKIYGLTHLAIADSDFYQREISAEKHAWILDYFENNFDAIAARTNPDMVAEIAICFKLAGRSDHPIVQRVQTYLLRHFETKQGAILKNGKADADAGEHRNIVAYLALGEWDELHSGPKLPSS